MAVREHDAVAIGPVRLRWVVLEELAPEDDREVGHAHRHAGVPRLGRLDRVHGQALDRVDGQIFEAGHSLSRWPRRSNTRPQGARVASATRFQPAVRTAESTATMSSYCADLSPR